MRRSPSFLLLPMLVSTLVVFVSDAGALAGDRIPGAGLPFVSDAGDAGQIGPQRLLEPEPLIPELTGADPGEVVPAALAEGAANAQDKPAPKDYFTLGELQEEMKKLVWVKGDNKIVPYGVLWGSASYDTERVNPGPYIVWVHSGADEGEDSFDIDTRRTRLGLDVTGPAIPLFDCTPLIGKVEVDFQGTLFSQETENRAVVLLRHAYGDIKNDNFRLMAGQTSDLISPLYPGTLNYSVGWYGGNIGYRRMQVRLERYLHPSDDMTLELQGAMAQNIISDFRATAGVERESSDWPVVQLRTGVQLKGLTAAASPVAAGISGHIGQQEFDFVAPLPVADDFRVRTWSFNADVRIPLTDRFGIQGEFFTGENLATFLGGIGQGVDLATRHGIRSTGGWVDAWYDVTPELHTHAGYSIDDPNDNDLHSVAQRTLNQFFFINGSYDVTKNLNLGLEISYWETLYLGRTEGKAVRFEFAGAYKF